MNMAIGLSHSPLSRVRPLGDERKAMIDAALVRARNSVAALRPDVAVVFFPDHYNGFFYDLMPQVCVGSAATGIGDFGTHAGGFRVDAGIASQLTTFLLSTGFDVAVSHEMKADHGLAQAIEILPSHPDETPVVPVFLNCVATPLSPCWRVADLGHAVGRFFAATGKRVVYIGSGGLSHDPPLPRIESQDEKERKSVTERRTLTSPERAAREARTRSFGELFARGETHLRPLNPAWDTTFMNQIAAGDWTSLRGLIDVDIAAEGGNSAHEIRTWIAAFAALGSPGPYSVEERLYVPVPEWIVGYGLMRAVSKERT